MGPPWQVYASSTWIKHVSTLVTSAVRTLLSAIVNSFHAKEHQSAAVGCREEIDAHLREFASQAVQRVCMSHFIATKQKQQVNTGETSWIVIRYINDTITLSTPILQWSKFSWQVLEWSEWSPLSRLPIFTAICFSLFWRCQALFSQQARKQVNKETRKQASKEVRKEGRKKGSKREAM